MKASALLDDNTPPRILIYGAGGTGKTALVSQAKGGYLMDFDRGMRTAATLKDKWSEHRNQIEFDNFSETNPNRPSAWLKAKQKLIEIMNAVIADKWEFDCLIIDSLSGMSEVIQNQMMAAVNKPMAKPQLNEWGDIVGEVSNALQIIKAINCLILVTAHELPIQVDNTTVMKILAPGTKLPALIPTWFDEIWYAKSKPGVGKGPNTYIVSGRKTLSICARTRSSMTYDFPHNECGLVGVLKETGFSY